MFNELERLREGADLFGLLSHYAEVAAPDRQAWQDRKMPNNAQDPREWTRLHGELLAYGWVEMNAGEVPVLRLGEAALCYRVTRAGLRALEQVKAGEID